jgi:hypothetical protein
MPCSVRPVEATPPRNLCELLLRDIASLLIMSRLISHSVKALRPRCSFSPDLTASLDSIAATSEAGERLLHPPLTESGTVLPYTPDSGGHALRTDFFTQLPDQAAHDVLAADVDANLHLLAQHLEQKTRLAAEEALLVGQNSLCRALLGWAVEWHDCSRVLRLATVRARARAYFAEWNVSAVPQGA